jgi:inhibitor of KinA
VKAPVIRAVGEAALLIELGDFVSEETHRRVLDLDSALGAAGIAGICETAPAYTSVLVRYDPDLLTFETLRRLCEPLIPLSGNADRVGRQHVVPVCFDSVFAPDLGEVADRLALTPEAVAEHLLAATFRVYMYGFAPGYAYMGGVPPILHQPRKPAAVRGYPVGSVLIAGPQCLITTLPMPTGWWVVGRTPLTLLDRDADAPPLFQPGDTVRFRRIEPDEFGQGAAT